jgi:hypothetical protein
MKDKCDMKLSKEQVEVLRQFESYKPKYVPVTYFKGKQYIVFKDLKDDVDLNIQGDVIAPLFENGYLEMTSGNTCILTEYGQQILERTLNLVKGAVK